MALIKYITFFIFKNILNDNLANLLNKLWKRFNKKRKKQLGLLLIITLFSALAEIMTLGAVFPFIGVITNPDKVFEYPLIGNVIRYLNIESKKDLVFFITCSFAGLAFTAGLIRIIVLWVTTRLAFSAGAELSIEAYRRALFQPYKVHISRNSSEVISAILMKINSTINWVVLPILMTVSATLVLISMVITLLAINFKISVITIFSFWFMYFIFSIISRKKLADYSSIVSKEQNQITKALQEGFGGIRDVILNGQQLVFCDIYAKSDYPLRRSQGNITLISMTPRYVLEAFGLIFVSILAYFLNQKNIGGTFALQTLGIIALSAQRLLPLLQQIYSTRTNILAHESVLTDVIDLLYMELPNTNQRKLLNNLSFQKSVDFKNISFRYVKDGPTVLKNINFKIHKGSRVGFIGPTGSGKSTLVDILMGLLRPNDGEVLIDEIRLSGKNINGWQSKICHVPQSIFLTDNTISENIAFGIDKELIDHKRVKDAAEQAQISDFINNSIDGYDTIVGERGVKLSGGQRQRIAIARALYKDADVLVFDEATSALDISTEKLVMDSISSLNKKLTIIIIAHRITTLQNCDKIIKIENGEIFYQGIYDNIPNQG